MDITRAIKSYNTKSAYMKAYWKRPEVRARKLARDNCDAVRTRKRSAWRKVRLEVLSHYSSGNPRCSCCGEQEIAFLALDHINGGGRQHRLATKGASNLAYWLRKEGYPSGFQVLCHNCNTAKHQLGQCPHSTSPRPYSTA